MNSHLQHINLIQSLNVSKLDESHINFIEDLILKDLNTMCVQNKYDLILPLALSWAEYDSPLKLKLLSCKILGETISNIDDSLVLQRHVLPITQYLLQDTKPQVRSSICKQLPNLFCKVDKLCENILLTSLLDAAQDTSSLVKSAVLEVLIDSEPYIYKGYIKDLIIPTLKKLIESCFIAQDEFLLHVAKVYSRLCNTYKEYMELDDQVWFVSYYSKICQVGTEDITTFCASSLIHMMLFAKSNPSLCQLLVSSLLDTCTRPFVSVKQILATTLFEVVKTCEERSRKMLLKVLMILLNEKVEIFHSIIPNLFALISLVLETDRRDILLVEKLLCSLRICEETISKSYNWRLHVIVFQEIHRFAILFPLEVILDHFQETLLIRIKKCRPLPSRLAASKTLLLLLEKLNNDNVSARCFSRIHKDLYCSKSFYDRNLFVKLCHQAIQIISFEQFRKYFLPSLLLLSADPVANIRYSVSSILVHASVRLMSDPGPNPELSTRIKQALSELKEDDDVDVKSNVITLESKFKEKRASVLLNLLIEPSYMEDDDINQNTLQNNPNQTIDHSPTRTMIIHPYMKASIEKEFIIDAGIPLNSTTMNEYCKQNNVTMETDEYNKNISVALETNETFNQNLNEISKIEKLNKINKLYESNETTPHILNKTHNNNTATIINNNFNENTININPQITNDNYIKTIERNKTIDTNLNILPYNNINTSFENNANLNANVIAYNNINAHYKNHFNDFNKSEANLNEYIIAYNNINENTIPYNTTLETNVNMSYNNLNIKYETQNDKLKNKMKQNYISETNEIGHNINKNVELNLNDKHVIDNNGNVSNVINETNAISVETIETYDNVILNNTNGISNEIIEQYNVNEYDNNDIVKRNQNVKNIPKGISKENYNTIPKNSNLKYQTNKPKNNCIEPNSKLTSQFNKLRWSSSGNSSSVKASEPSTSLLKICEPKLGTQNHEICIKEKQGLTNVDSKLSKIESDTNHVKSDSNQYNNELSDSTNKFNALKKTSFVPQFLFQKNTKRKSIHIMETSKTNNEKTGKNSGEIDNENKLYEKQKQSLIPNIQNKRKSMYQPSDRDSIFTTFIKGQQKLNGQNKMNELKNQSNISNQNVDPVECNEHEDQSNQFNDTIEETIKSTIPEMTTTNTLPRVNKYVNKTDVAPTLAPRRIKTPENVYYRDNRQAPSSQSPVECTTSVANIDFKRKMIEPNITTNPSLSNSKIQSSKSSFGYKSNSNDIILIKKIDHPTNISPLSQNTEKQDLVSLQSKPNNSDCIINKHQDNLNLRNKPLLPERINNFKQPKINHIDLQNNEIIFYKEKNISDVEISHLDLNQTIGTLHSHGDILPADTRPAHIHFTEENMKNSNYIYKAIPNSKIENNLIHIPLESFSEDKFLVLEPPRQYATEPSHQYVTNQEASRQFVTNQETSHQYVMDQERSHQNVTDLSKHVQQLSDTENDITQKILNLTNEVETIDQYLNLESPIKDPIPHPENYPNIKTNLNESNNKLPEVNAEIKESNIQNFNSNKLWPECRVVENNTTTNNTININNNVNPKPIAEQIKLRRDKKTNIKSIFPTHKGILGGAVVTPEECKRLSLDFEKELIELNNKIKEINEEIRLETLNLQHVKNKQIVETNKKELNLPGQIAKQPDLDITLKNIPPSYSVPKVKSNKKEQPYQMVTQFNVNLVNNIPPSYSTMERSSPAIDTQNKTEQLKTNTNIQIDIKYKELPDYTTPKHNQTDKITLPILKTTLNEIKEEQILQINTEIDEISNTITNDIIQTQSQIHKISNRTIDKPINKLIEPITNQTNQINENRETSNELIETQISNDKIFKESKLKRHMYRRSYDERINKLNFNTNKTDPNIQFNKQSLHRRSFDEKKYSSNENLIKNLPPKIPSNLNGGNLNGTLENNSNGKKIPNYQIFSDRRKNILENKSFTVRIGSTSPQTVPTKSQQMIGSANQQIIGSTDPQSIRSTSPQTNISLSSQQTFGPTNSQIKIEKDCHPVNNSVDIKTNPGIKLQTNLSDTNNQVLNEKLNHTIEDNVNESNIPSSVHNPESKIDKQLEKHSESIISEKPNSASSNTENNTNTVKSNLLIGKPRVSVSPLKYSIPKKVSTLTDTNKTESSNIPQIPRYGSSLELRNNFKVRSLSPQNINENKKQLTDHDDTKAFEKVAEVPWRKPMSRMQTPRSISQIIESQIPGLESSNTTWNENNENSGNNKMGSKEIQRNRITKSPSPSRIIPVANNSNGNKKQLIKPKVESNEHTIGGSKVKVTTKIIDNNISNEFNTNLKRIPNSPTVSVRKVIPNSNESATKLIKISSNTFNSNKNYQSEEQSKNSNESLTNEIKTPTTIVTIRRTNSSGSSESLPKYSKNHGIVSNNSDMTRKNSSNSLKSDDSNHSKNEQNCETDSGSKIPGKRNFKSSKFMCLRSEQESGFHKSASDERPKSCIVPNSVYATDKGNTNLKSISEENLQHQNRKSGTSNVPVICSKLPRRSIKF